MNKFFDKFKKQVTDTTPAEKIDTTQRLDKMVFMVICAVVFLLPLLFVPVLANWFELSKSSFLLVGTLIALTLWLARVALNKKFEIIRSPFDLSLLIFVLISFVSAYLAVNRVQNLVADPIIYLGAFLLFFLISQVVKKETNLTSLANVVLASGAVLSVWSLIQMAATFAKLTFPLFSLAFSPAGSYLVQGMLLVAILPLAIGLYVKSKRGVQGLLLVAIVLGILASIFTIYKNPPVLLGVETGWKISTGTMGRSITSAIFGMGPANYVDAFTLYKPADFNSSPYWNLRFTGGANFYFYVLSTLGIAGLAVLAIFIVKLLLLAQKRLELPSTGSVEKGLLGSLVLILVMFFFLPGPGVLIAVFFALLGLLVAHFNISENFSLVKNQKLAETNNVWAAFIPAVLVLAAAIGSIYFLGKMLVADYYYGVSLAAASANLGTKTYNSQIQAISLNPDNDTYHASYSQTNLALADAIAAQPNLTDQQKSTVIQLVQQAIREARAAATINPNRASNWENLSVIYRSLINFAQGADQWTVASMNQAIALNPTNPQLRLDLGGLYFSAKDYNTAGQLFSQAIGLKQDFANAHYNLAQAYKNLNVKDQAITELQTTASLVCAAGQSADCDRVNKEIADLNAAVANPPAASPSPDLSVATPSANVNLPKAKTVPPVKIGTPSGQITP